MNEIKNIVPTLDAQGRLSKLTFTASVTNANNQAFTEDVVLERQLPGSLAGLDENNMYKAYTPAELLAIASGYADTSGIMSRLQMQALSAMTPIFDPSSIPPTPPLTLNQVKMIAMENIDAVVADVSSSFTRFQMEYEEREKAAIAFKAAGYTGDPTIWITSFATSVGMSTTQATDLILSQATQLRGAVSQLGAARMGKYRVQSATTIAEVTTIYDTLIAEIETIKQNLP